MTPSLAPIRRMAMRFPLPALLSLGFAFLSVDESVELRNLTMRDEAMMGLVLGFFWCLAAALAAEARGMPRWMGWIAGLAMTTASTVLLFSAVPVGRFYPLPPGGFVGLLLLVGAMATVLAAALPRLSGTDGTALWRFVALSLEGAAIAFAGAVLLAIGLSALLGSLEYLFRIDLPSQSISKVWQVSMSLVWPWRALSSLPAIGGDAKEARDAPKLQLDAAQRLLADWVLVPIWAAYLVVLYAYAAKIALAGELPRGNVAWMVHGFGAYGVALWLVVWPRRTDGPVLTRCFARWFFPSLAVPLALLAVGTAERVAAYGWTEPRYLVALTGLWLVASALVFTLRRDRAPIQLLPITLAALSVLACIGPWSASAVALRDQQARLAALLARHQILVDGRINKAAGERSSMTTAELQQVASHVAFLADRRQLDRLKTWFGDGDVVTTAEKWAARPVIAAMGLPYREGVAAHAGARCYVNTAYDAEYESRGGLLLDIAGFDLATLLHFRGRTDWTLAHPDGVRSYSIALDRNQAKLSISGPTLEKRDIDLWPILGALCRAAHGNPTLSIGQSAPAVVAVEIAESVKLRLAVVSAHLDDMDRPEVRRGSVTHLTVLVAIADKRP